MLRFVYDKCIGCAACARDCFPKALSFEDGRPYLSDAENCLACGHCIAVCPKKAVLDDELDMQELVSAEKWRVSPDDFSNMLKLRRSVRSFESEGVSDDEIRLIIDAGRFAPTACNAQDIDYVVLRGDLKQIQKLALSALADFGRQAIANAKAGDDLFRAKRFIKWREEFESNPEACEHLLFGARCLVLLCSGTDDGKDAAGAAAYMELQTAALGLGALYSGYFCLALAQSAQLREMCGIADGRAVSRALVIGKSKVKFHRSAPRKQARVKYLEF